MESLLAQRRAAIKRPSRVCPLHRRRRPLRNEVRAVLRRARARADEKHVQKAPNILAVLVLLNQMPRAGAAILVVLLLVRFYEISRRSRRSA